MEPTESIFVHFCEALESEAPAHGGGGKCDIALFWADSMPRRGIDIRNDGVDLFDSLLKLVVGVCWRQSQFEDETVDLVDYHCNGHLVVHEVFDDTFSRQHDLKNMSVSFNEEARDRCG